MTAALRADGFLRYDFGADRIADPVTRSRLARLQDDLRTSAHTPATNLISAARTILADIAAECADTASDHADSIRVTSSALTNAERLLLELHAFLPISVPVPHIAAEPDGELSITWDAAPDLLFSMSVGESGIVSFASRLAQGVEFHGKAQLGATSDKFMRTLADTIAGLFAVAPAARRR